MSVVLDLTDEFPSPHISTSPYWVLGFVRLKYPVSYSRKNKKSISAIAGDGASVRADNLILTDECIGMHISRPKGNHIKTLSANLKKTGKELLTEIIPGDWVFAWIVNSEDEGKELVRRIKNGEACNKKGDGLKFIGRVSNLTKSVDGTPVHAATYSLSAYAFREMESLMFYDPLLANINVTSGDPASWMALFGFDYEKMFIPVIKSMFDDNIIDILRSHIELILGKGAPASEIDPVGPPQLNATHGQTTGKPESPPFAYVVPAEVGKWIGKNSRNGSGKIMAYADTLELLMGVQEHSGKYYPSLSSKDGMFKQTGKPLLGAIMPIQPAAMNRPLWGMLEQFSNLTLNEIYTCLKLNDQDEIVPTFVARQKPFSTDAVTNTENLPYTKFTDLPRWKIDPSMVESYSIGRGEASRCNLVRVTGTAQHVATGITATQQALDNPLLADSIDIQRSGPYTYVQVADVTEGSQIGTIPGKFMNLIADWSMGNHLCFQGNMTTVGFQSPICEGDNIEYSGVVFHIESIDFSCGISGGHKTFRTHFNLSNGLEEGTTQLSDQDGDMPNYPGIPGNGQNTGPETPFTEIRLPGTSSNT